jgi:1-deoxy-D-xylulose-5-phosphate synthase
MKDSYPILDRIGSAEDLRELSPEETDELADEIRDYLVATVPVTGGHLASNLGVVELTLALHRVFDTPRDSIVWDVGHQSYVHKLVTGRRDRFDTLRKPGGLSGFTKRSESEYDIFGAGHSSTSLSAALGIAEAEKLRGGTSYTVAVIGDGAFTGGMIHEALNNCPSASDLRLVIVINENEMSISKNIGAFARSLSKLRSTPGYFRTKNATKSFLSHIPLLGKPLTKLVVSLKKMIKNALYGSNIFEDLGLFYLGPVDGNDRRQLEAVLTEASKTVGSTVVHVKTVKGKGYEPAEKNPDEYHSIPPAGSETGNAFSAAFGETLCREAEVEPRLCAVTAAMEKGTGLSDFHRRYPDRFFDVGIAEEHAVTFSAGLSAGGMIPVCAIYSTFLQRAFDSVIHDAALQSLPLVLCIDRAGLNSGDGATHHGIFDVSFLSSVPGTEIFTPATVDALRASVRAAIASGAVAAVRYPSGGEDPLVVSEFYPEGFTALSGVRFSRMSGDSIPDIVIICHGRMARTAIDAADILKKRGIDCGLALCEIIKPYEVPAKLICDRLGEGKRHLVFIEEEIRSGGFGMNLSDAIDRISAPGIFRSLVIGTEESFAVPAESETVFSAAGVSPEQIAGRTEAFLKNG